MKIKRFLSDSITILVFIIVCWMTVSWIDVLLHNDPVYGDKQYMPGNAIVMLVKLAG